MSSSEARTRGVRIQVKSRFVSERSSVDHGTWFFAYTVLITNEGTDTVQLTSRHWIITNADGHVEEVRGPGVVGAQPVLQPGESFEYTSGCPLTTPSGLMQGAYQFEDEKGGFFEAKNPLFALDSPYDERRPN